MSEDSGDKNGKMSETLKKIFATGVSAAFMTEDSIRKLVGDLHLPKESLNLLLAGAARSKEELMNRVSREVISIISKIDFVKEASRFVEEHKFRVVAEIEVLPKTGSREARTGPTEPGLNSDPGAPVAPVVSSDSHGVRDLGAEATSKVDFKFGPKS